MTRLKNYQSSLNIFQYPTVPKFTFAASKTWSLAG